MAELYGALVGSVKQLTPTRPVDASYENTRDEVIVRDTIALAAAPATTTIQCALVGWETVLDEFDCNVAWGAMGAGVTLSLGDVTHPTALMNATAVNAAGSVGNLSAVAIANYFQPLWQLLGYATLAAAKLVGLNCELLFTIGTAAATGQITWSLKGQKRI